MPTIFPRSSPLTVRSFMRRVSIALLLPACPTGCGGPGPYSGALYPVTGQVLLADGTPLTGGSVQFIPKLGGLPAHGTIGPNGTFSLQSLKSREGAAPGEYKVRIEASSELRAREGKLPRSFHFPPSTASTMGRPG